MDTNPWTQTKPDLCVHILPVPGKIERTTNKVGTDVETKTRGTVAQTATIKIHNHNDLPRSHQIRMQQQQDQQVSPKAVHLEYQSFLTDMRHVRYYFDTSLIYKIYV